MIITVATDDGKSSQIEVPSTTLVSFVKTLVAPKLGLRPGAQAIFNGQPLSDNTSLSRAGVGDQDLLLFVDGEGGALGAVGSASVAASPSSRPTLPTLADMKGLNPNGMLTFFEGNPQLLRQLHHENPDLAEAIETGDVVKVRVCLMTQQMEGHKRMWTQQTERAELFANPDSEENQAKIQRMIEQEAIDQNYAMAMEEAPEVFARVSMLYIDTEINGKSIKAFVDSGAQLTIMSAVCAERCGLMRLVDRRFHGEARGVGTGKIIGKIHMAQIKIGDHFFPCSFTILETSDVEFLFGLDMLKRHLCVIDLKKGELALGSAGATVPFLSEKDLPLSARETRADDLNRKPSADGREEGTGSAVAASSPPPAPETPFSPIVTGSTATATVPPRGGGVDETKVSRLVGMGFTRHQAVAALESTGDDVDQAAALLLAQIDT